MIISRFPVAIFKEHHIDGFGFRRCRARTRRKMSSAAQQEWPPSFRPIEMASGDRQAAFHPVSPPIVCIAPTRSNSSAQEIHAARWNQHGRQHVACRSTRPRHNRRSAAGVSHRLALGLAGQPFQAAHDQWRRGHRARSLAPHPARMASDAEDGRGAGRGGGARSWTPSSDAVVGRVE